MSLKSSENVGTNEYKLAIEIDGEKFEDAINRVFKQQRKNISIPGFRKGKATRGMVERMYGEGVFYNDAFELLFPEVVGEAVTEAGLEIVDNPHDVEIEEVGKDGVKFTINVTVKPDVELGDYKGLKIEKKSTDVSDEDVDNYISNLRERGARYEEVDRKAKNEDLTIIDFEGFVDDVAFDGGKAEGYELTLGSGQFIPGFEDQIVGHKAGDEFDVNVTFPEDYNAADLNGKDAVFKIKLHNVKEKQLPDLDDDFALDVGYENLDDMKKKVREDLETQKKDLAEGDMEASIYEQLGALVNSEIPEAMYESQVDSDLQELNYNMQSQGLDLQTYMKYTGMDEAQVRESLRPRAENQVKCRLALEKIAKLENLEATEDDINARYKELAEQYNMEEDAIRKILSADDMTEEIVNKKALELVKAAAKVTEEKPAAKKKAPAKKSTAKKADDKAEEKKPAAKKTTTKKSTAKKADDKDAEKKPAAKKPAAKKTTAKKETAAKKPAAKKTTKKADEEK